MLKYIFVLLSPIAVIKNAGGATQDLDLFLLVAHVSAGPVGYPDDGNHFTSVENGHTQEVAQRRVPWGPTAGARIVRRVIGDDGPA